MTESQPITGELDPRVAAMVFGMIEERERHAAELADAWRAGYEARGADEHEAGYVQCIEDLKAMQHGVVLDLRAHLTMWDGLRTRFADPRPGDLTGPELVEQARASWAEVEASGQQQTA